MKNLIMTLLIFGMLPLTATAQELEPRRQAATLYNRLNGVPPSPARLNLITKAIEAGNLRKAALLSVDDGFYNTTLRNMVAEWTNEAVTRRVDLNDYTATVIGMVRDDVSFDRVLWDDIVYVIDQQDLPPYSLVNDDHYTEAEDRNINLAEKLVRKKQSELVETLPADATAGVLTSHAFARAYFQDGTNRAAFKFTMKTYFCKEMEELTDNTRSDFRIRQDVDRSPGGDTKVFRNKCAGCHSGMDPMAGSMAFYDYTADDGLVYNPNRIPDKYFRGLDTFPKGYITKDDSWVNQWVEGNNKSLGWNGRQSGKGLKSWGRMISQADQFPKCMAQRALFEVCRSKDKQVINQLANRFKAKGRFNLKYLFAEAALSCRNN